MDGHDVGMQVDRPAPAVQRSPGSWDKTGQIAEAYSGQMEMARPAAKIGKVFTRTSRHPMEAASICCHHKASRLRLGLHRWRFSIPVAQILVVLAVPDRSCRPRKTLCQSAEDGEIASTRTICHCGRTLQPPCRRAIFEALQQEVSQ